VLDFAGADAVGQRAECAMGGGVRVTAHHRHARQRGALLRADHVHDALALGQEREVGGRAKFAMFLSSVVTCSLLIGSVMPS
jgi:hypothetical protein